METERKKERNIRQMEECLAEWFGEMEDKEELNTGKRRRWVKEY